MASVTVAQGIKDSSVAKDLIAKNHFENRQLSLFQNFLCNSEEEKNALSNSIELWDIVPRYSATREAMSKMRSVDGNLPILKIEFQHRKSFFQISIHPTVVEELKKNKITGEKEIIQIAYYPSINEELVEEALRKLAVDAGSGFYDKTNARSGVVFTLYQLRAELKQRGHTRSFTEIVTSLDILNGSNIHISEASGDDVVKSPVLPVMMRSTRKKIAADPNAKCFVQFHPLVTESIDRLSYRQFNYQQLMKHKTQLARWINNLLIQKYVFASKTAPFEMCYSTVKRDSAMLNGYSRERAAQKACETSIDELVENGVLHSYTKKIKPGLRGKILDVVYTLNPSMQFVNDAKTTNSRVKKNDEKLSTAAKSR